MEENVKAIQFLWIVVNMMNVKIMDAVERARV